jgi:hypothetical protein
LAAASRIDISATTAGGGVAFSGLGFGENIEEREIERL